MPRQKDGFYEKCTACGKTVYCPPSKRKGRPFCSRACHMAFLNRELNPTRMTPDVRLKIHQSMVGTGNGKTYERLFGKHTHRRVAELMLARELNPGEVVHHVDGNKRNNSPDNLIIFSSQSEHAAWHARKGGGFE